MKNYLLLLETATTNCSVAIALDGEILFCKEQNQEQFRHSDHLHQFISETVAACGLSFSDLSAVAVSMGPGSYTGLRIGVSAAKGICYAQDIPLIAVNTLEVLANAYMPKKNDLLLPMIDARRMEVFLMVFDDEHQPLFPTSATIITPNILDDLPKGRKVIFGSGAEKCKAIFHQEEIVYKEDIHVPSSRNMVKIATHKFEQKNFEDVAYFEPFYLKDFYTNAPKKA